MKLHLKTSKIKQNSAVVITGSKSESNRLLLLKALYPQLSITNLSNSDDTQLMDTALANSAAKIDIHHAGTAMRFLTAFYATQEGKQVLLTGSPRMQQRPIKILVDALRALGADITYEINEGFPPLRIKGKKLSRAEVSLSAAVSSQYISALLLVAPSLSNGLKLKLEGHITSTPYINMTLSLLRQIGVKAKFEENTITVLPVIAVPSNEMVVESDWSSASYFYSLVALSPLGTQIQMSSYQKNSLQGDSVLADIYSSLGVSTEYGNSNTISLKKVRSADTAKLNLDLSNSPDIAQTIVVSCLALQLECHIDGLHTLKIKETDRLQALKNEIQKLGSVLKITERSLTLERPRPLTSGALIDTYNDHRMAMAFAPLILKTNLFINDAEVVSKSFPDFWNNLRSLGLEIY